MPVADAPTLRALLAPPRPAAAPRRRDGARSRAPSTARALGAQLGPRRPDAVPLRGPRAADDGHAVPGRRRRPRRLRAYVRRLARARCGRPRLRHRGRARRHPAGARRRVPRRADAAVRGALPHAVHRRGARERRGDRRAVVRAPQLGARRAARDRARRAPARRARRDARRARAAARHVGRACSTPPATLVREHPVGGLDADVADELRAEVDAVLRRGARAGSSLRIGDTPFTLQTLGRGGHLRGVIAIAAGDLDQEGRGVVTAVIAMAGPRPRAAPGARPRARRAASGTRAVAAAPAIPALARRIVRDLWGGAARRRRCSSR